MPCSILGAATVRGEPVPSLDDGRDRWHRVAGRSKTRSREDHPRRRLRHGSRGDRRGAHLPCRPGGCDRSEPREPGLRDEKGRRAARRKRVLSSGGYSRRLAPGEELRPRRLFRRSASYARPRRGPASAPRRARAARGARKLRFTARSRGRRTPRRANGRGARHCPTPDAETFALLSSNAPTATR